MAQHFEFSDSHIFLGPIKKSLHQWLQAHHYEQIFIISDFNTHRYCLSLLPDIMAGEFIVGENANTKQAQTGAGMEQYKILPSCEAIWQTMFDAKLDRRALVVNLGGGVVGDMGGFCAATYKRGIDFIQIPTSLLAMTDAAIGGKLGVDFRGIKNAVGLFQNPAAVFIDPVFLKTLPVRELRSGFAEVIKHARIGAPALWENIQAISPDNLAAANWIEILEAPIAVKTQIVAQDPHEAGIRALLNFGHTFGHALESYFLRTNNPLTHGEAVAIGMLCESPSPGAIAPTIFRFFEHRAIPESAFPELWKLMELDKKNTSGTVRMAVPDVDPYSMQWLALSPDDAMHRLRIYNALGV